MIQDAGWTGGQHPMARAYSLDLRERVVAAVAAGESCRTGCDLQGQCGECGEVVATVPGDRERGGAQSRWSAALCAGRRANVAAGAPFREARHHIAGARRGARRAGNQGEPLRGLALLRARRHQLQKKACTPASRIAPTSHGGGRSGRSIKAGLIPRVSSSSTRPGPRPT